MKIKIELNDEILSSILADVTYEQIYDELKKRIKKSELDKEQVLIAEVTCHLLLWLRSSEKTKEFKSKREVPSEVLFNEEEWRNRCFELFGI